MKFFEKVRRILEISSGFPRVIGDRITLPFDEIEELAT